MKLADLSVIKMPKISFWQVLPWLALAGLYGPVLILLYSERWVTLDYTHAYFILPISIFLAWRMRAKLMRLTSCLPAGQAGVMRPQFLVLLIFGLLTFIFGWRQDYLFITTFSLIPVLFGLTGYLYGPSVAKALSFPILYILLMVPPPLAVLDSITVPMRYGISILVEQILQIFKYPMIRDGLLFKLGGHEIYMGAPCSGFRSLITMISLGIAYVYLNTGSLRKKALLLASIIPLALLGNLVRVLGVCLATYHLNEAAGVKFHDYGGVVIFLVLVFGLMGLDSLLEKLKL